MAKSEEQPKQLPESSAITVFLNKLKEQSFTVVLMVLIVYYQHVAWQQDKKDMMTEIHAKETQIMSLMERERDRILEREKLLRDQRDQFIEMIKEEAAWNKAELRLRNHK